MIRYRKFDTSLLLLELVNATVQNGDITPTSGNKGSTNKTFIESLDLSNTDLKDRYEALKAFALALGDDVPVKSTKLLWRFGG